MENKLILILVAFFALSIGCSCTLSTKDECMVGMGRINKNENEFFVIYGNDTSDCSYIFRKTERDEIVISTYLNSYYKLYQSMMARNVADTTAVEEIVKACNYRHPNYNDMIHELDLCLSKASQIYDLSRLKHINTYLSDYDSIAIKVTQIVYLSNSDKGRTTLNRMENAIKETDFSKDLDKVFKKHNIYVDDILCLDMLAPYLYNDKCSKKSNKMPNGILNAEIRIKLRKI